MQLHRGHRSLSGTGCVDLNACVSHLCGVQSVQCTDIAAPAPNTAAGRTCACHPGYEGNPESGCTEIDACVSFGCGVNETCTDIVGGPNSAVGRTCACDPGYQSDATGCVDIDACATSPCSGGAFCADRPPPALEGPSGRTCSCPPAYVYEQGTGCVDEIDACLTHPCPDYTTCIDLPPPAVDAPEGRACRPDEVVIEAGQLSMGSPAWEVGRAADEVQHSVSLTYDFWMQTTEVTQAQWLDLMGLQGWSFTECGGNCPMESITWFRALDYANALSAAHGLEPCYEVFSCQDNFSGSCVTFIGLACEGYRLPTEAEWEFAARAGMTTATYNGDTGTGTELNPSLDHIAWYVANSDASPHPVALKAPNDWGLYDMMGNVREWVFDAYAAYCAGAPCPDPVVDPYAESDPTFQDYRVRRGGGWSNEIQHVRSAFRGNGLSVAPSTGTGFRLVRTMP